jgi:thioredoxin-dependent peroxiredoxin
MTKNTTVHDTLNVISEENILNSNTPVNNTPVLLQTIQGIYACTHDGEFNFTQNTLNNKYVVLYFYPKDNTPGCTTQALDFRDAHQTCIDKDIIVLGVSRDNLKSHISFTQKFNLPFNLICDTEEQLCAQFDVVKPKNMYGKIVRGIQRSTFIYNKQGQLIQALRNIKATNHVADVLKIIDAHGV